MVLAALAAARPAQWEWALALLDQMPSLGLEPDEYSFSSAITACARGGEPERALEVFRRSSAAGKATEAVFNNVLLCCQRARSVSYTHLTLPTIYSV